MNISTAAQHNMDIIKQGFGINDAHITVLQMICNDVACNKLRMSPDPPDVIEWYAERHEKGEPPLDYYDGLPEGCCPVRTPGQHIDLHWYHDRFNTLSRFLAFILWLKKATGHGETDAQKQDGDSDDEGRTSDREDVGSGRNEEDSLSEVPQPSGADASA
jgi:hypothetical protein